MIIVTVFVAVYLANTYERIVANEQLAMISQNYATITFIMQNSVKILIAAWAISILIIFGKVVGGGGGITNQPDI